MFVSLQFIARLAKELSITIADQEVNMIISREPLSNGKGNQVLRLGQFSGAIHVTDRSR
jgi:hypothetical protein